MKEIITRFSSIKIYIIYVPSQQLQGQLQKWPNVDAVTYITDNIHWTTLNHITMENCLFLFYTTKKKA
jgi:hypothetical protein